MLIDLSAIMSLELISNVRQPMSKLSLFGLLNQTTTKMGARLLRTNLLQPSTQKEMILDPRYAAVDELSTSEEMFHHVRTGTHLAYSIDRVYTTDVFQPSRSLVMWKDFSQG